MENGMGKYKKLHLIFFLLFLSINLITLALIEFEWITYGPDLQDVFMSFLIVVVIGISSILYFLIKVDEQKGFWLIHYLLYLGYVLEVSYLLFEN